MKNKHGENVLTEADLSVIARIIGCRSSLLTSTKEDGVWRSRNIFEIGDPYHRTYDIYAKYAT